MVIQESVITFSLLFLAVLDGLLALWTFLLPDGFYRFFFGKNRPGNGDLIYRTGGLWLTFSLLQFLALFLWTTNPFWLLIVTGVRLSEWCADWLLLLAEKDFTLFGSMGFLLSVPFTVTFGLLFYLGFQSVVLPDPTVFFAAFYRPSPSVIYGLLLLLILIDSGLALLVLRSPERWYRWMHAGDQPASGELLSRTGGVWFGFALLQLTVLGTWTFFPEGLVILAGLRLTEVLADWIYLATSTSRTRTLVVALLMSPPVNAAVAFVFYQGYLTGYSI